MFVFIQQKSAGFKSGANRAHVEEQHTSVECPPKGSEAVYWEYELLMVLWLGTWLWSQAPIVYLQLEIPKVLAATDMGEERHGLVNAGPQGKQAEGVFFWIIEKNPAWIEGNASFRPVLSLHEFSLIQIFATNIRIY